MVGITDVVQERIARIATRHSKPDNNMTHQFRCNLCRDKGLVLSSDGQWARPCQCVQQQAVLNRFKLGQFTPEMLSCTFGNFNLDYYDTNKKDSVKNLSYHESAELAKNAAMEFTKECIENPHVDGLLFTGPVGSGKSCLASCIANALMEYGISVLFMVVPDLLDELKATYDYHKNNPELTEQHLIDTARKVQVLVLDDLGAHNYTDWTRNKIYSIVNYRLNHRLPTIITTNLKLSELKEYLGERTTSRLIQMCRPYRLLSDKDIRMVKRHEKEIRKI